MSKSENYRSFAHMMFFVSADGDYYQHVLLQDMRDADYSEWYKEAGKGYTLQRYKGLGEMNPEQLWETTMDPSQRKLMQVTIEDAAETDRRVSILMGDKVDPRREYISQHANFNREDSFMAISDQLNEGRND